MDSLTKKFLLKLHSVDDFSWLASSHDVVELGGSALYPRPLGCLCFCDPWNFVISLKKKHMIKLNNTTSTKST